VQCEMIVIKESEDGSVRFLTFDAL
jgi:hypothetical protein